MVWELSSLFCLLAREPRGRPRASSHQIGPSKGWHGIGPIKGMARNWSNQRDGTDLDQSSRNGTELDLSSRNGTELDQSSRNGTELDQSSRIGTGFQKKLGKTAVGIELGNCC